MTGRMKFFAAMLGVAGIAGLTATNADASVSAYVGRGKPTGVGSVGSAPNAWVFGSGGTGNCSTGCVQTATPTNTLTANPLVANVPLAVSTGLQATASGGTGIQFGLNTMFNTDAGNLSGNAVVSAGLRRSITLSGFSSAFTSFGFYLENGSAIPQANDVVVTLTDATGTTTITVNSATGGVVRSGTSPISGTPLKTTTGQTSFLISGPPTASPNASDPNATTQNSEFFGFTGVTGITSVSINGGAGVLIDVGDFFEATPEPASLALLGAGLLGLGIARRRKAA